MGFSLCHGFDQGILAGRQPHVLPIVALGLKGVRQAGKYHGDFCRLCRSHCLCHQVFPYHIVRGFIALGVEDGVVCRHFQCRLHLVTVDMRTAAALKTGAFRKLADKGSGFGFRKRQDMVFVFQQHHALGRDFPCQFVVCIAVEYCIRIPSVQIPLDNSQDTGDGSVQYGFRQSAAANRLDDFCIPHAERGGHFQIHAGFQVSHAVVDGTPVADHKAVEIPFAPQNVREGFFVFGGIDPVDAVIGTHHRPRLRLANGTFKCGEVNFPCRACVHLGGAAHAAVFLIVGIKVLDAGAHLLALYALNERCCHFAGNVGIFRVIFEVSAAQRRTLDVDCRPQQNADIFRLTLVSQSLAHAFHQTAVKRGRSGTARREADRLDAVVDAHVVAGFVLLSQTVRAVAHHHGGDPQPFDGLGMPKVAAGTKACLFFQCQLL